MMKKVITVMVGVIVLVALSAGWNYLNEPYPVFGAPYYTPQRSLIPVDSTENIGTSTTRWAEGWFANINVSGTCTGCGSGSAAVSTSTNETSGQIAYWTTTSASPALLGKVATTSVTLSSEFSHSATLGSVVGGSAGTLSLATNGVALSKLAQIASNTILGNSTGATGNVTAIATSSLGIALSDTTGILTPAKGGTGKDTSAYSGTLGINNGNYYQSATTTFSTGLTYSAGSVTVNTSQNIATLSNLTSNGIMFTSGGAGTLNVAAFSANTIPYVNPGGTGLNFTATSSLNLGISGGGTGLTSLTGNRILYSNNAGSALLQVATSSLNLGVSGGGTGLTSFTGNRMLYSDNAGTSLLQIATSSAVAGNGISLTGTAALVGSSALSIHNPFSIATTSSVTAPQLAYFTVAGGRTTLGSVATTSISCTGIASCSNLVTITSAAGGTTLSAAYDAWTHTGVFGQTTSATSTLLALTGSTYSLVASSSVMFGTAGADLRYDAANNRLGVASTTPAFRFSIGTAGSDFYIDSNGKVVARDTTNSWNGRLSPTRSFMLGSATTTTWTGTTSAAYVPKMAMPFAGTLRQVRCSASTTQAFLGVKVFIGTTAVSPAYFVASSTVGTVKFTASNTFSAGNVISAFFGTTTSDSNAQSINCTFDVTET